jgi:cell division protein FtsB
MSDRLGELLKDRRMRVGIIPQAVVVVLVLGLVGTLVVKPARQLLAQRARIQGAVHDLKEVRASNTELRQRIARLNNPDYIEQRAREGMGLIKPGETSYVVMPPARPAPDRRKGSHLRHDPRRKGQTPDGGAAGFLEFLGLY